MMVIMNILIIIIHLKQVTSFISKMITWPLLARLCFKKKLRSASLLWYTYKTLMNSILLLQEQTSLY